MTRSIRVTLVGSMLSGLAACISPPAPVVAPTPWPSAPSPPSIERAGWFPGPGGSAGHCVVSSYAGSPEPPPQRLVQESRSDEWYGAGNLWTGLVADGRAAVLPNGMLNVKIGWWRLADGDLGLRVERLDGPGTARPDVPDGYGSRGFQVSGAELSTPGCWRFRGTLNGVEVSFVALIHS